MPNLTLHSPLGGVNRQTEFQNQPPYTCFDALNFWGIDGANKRRRVSTRPGWSTLSGTAANGFSIIGVAAGEDADLQLVAAAGGNLYKWTGSSFTSVGAGISTAPSLAFAPFLDTVYIPNHGTPKKYTYGGSVATYTAGTGAIQSNCTLACTWANRIVFAAPSSDPNNWYMSRVDDPTDWLYAADDTGSPVAGTNIEGGRISEPLTALIPHNRECLIFCTYNGMTVLRGNPTDGGRTEVISKVLGPISRGAWCKTADDWTYMITRHGLYKMQPGCGSNPIPVSRKIPNELLAIDADNFNVSMAYCSVFNGIYLEVEGAADTAWWFDFEHEAFWPWTAIGATAMIRFGPEETGDNSGILVGTSTGVKQLKTSTAVGVGAYVKQGPFKLSKSRRDKSIIAGATAVFGSTTTDTTGTVAFYAGPDAYAAVLQPASRSYSATIANLDNDVHPRVGGHAGYIVYTLGSTTKHISIEEMALEIKPAGKERR